MDAAVRCSHAPLYLRSPITSLGRSQTRTHLLCSRDMCIRRFHWFSFAPFLRGGQCSSSYANIQSHGMSSSSPMNRVMKLASRAQLQVPPTRMCSLAYKSSLSRPFGRQYPRSQGSVLSSSRCYTSNASRLSPICHSKSLLPTSRPVNGHRFIQPTTAAPTQHQIRYASSGDSSSGALARTPLYDLHAKHGAKFGPFAGYDMPLYYQDLSHVESHHWVREKCGIFDVSHM